ncbi:3-phosphoserine/phosphohydroxythreonine transaminase [Myxococcota bacterium]|nr:3-phosphoserine/phosphohydroxythreonine transaminase [Myxococcota bacterium]
MSRCHNFSAGPAALPLPVLHELQAALVEFGDTGAGIMEISHRSKPFEAVLASAEARLRRLMAIPDDYVVLFLQGGASLQFYMLALNLLGDEGAAADYVVTGTWASKALQEARRVGDARAAWEGKAVEYRRLPTDQELTVREGARYLHYTTNNTIYGTQFHRTPKVSVPLVADMSSDICSRPVDTAAHDLIYAGAQKNLGPSGVTAVILSPWAQSQSRQTAKALPGGLPAMLDYGVAVDNTSMYNTPNTFGIFALERVLAWLEGQGGLSAMEAVNRQKAERLYAEIDRSGFWRPRADKADRSWMNVAWRLPTEELEARFVKEASAAGLKELKGHRSAGGIRASLYNATGLDAVDALVGFMREFERNNG